MFLRDLNKDIENLIPGQVLQFKTLGSATRNYPQWTLDPYVFEVGESSIILKLLANMDGESACIAATGNFTDPLFVPNAEQVYLLIDNYNNDAHG